MKRAQKEVDMTLEKTYDPRKIQKAPETSRNFVEGKVERSEQNSKAFAKRTREVYMTLEKVHEPTKVKFKKLT